VAVIVLMGVGSARAELMTIDFSLYNTGLYLSGPGFTPTQNGDFSGWIVVGDDWIPGPLSIELGPNGNMLSPLNYVGEIDAKFDDQANFVKVNIVDVSGSDSLRVEVNLVDSGGNYYGDTIFMGKGSHTISNLGMFSEVDFLSDVPFAIDFLEYGVASVPEPATLLLLGGGLVGAFFARRRIR
jgi:hypothetical protein